MAFPPQFGRGGGICSPSALVFTAQRYWEAQKCAMALLSVCLSVTLIFHVETLKRVIKQLCFLQTSDMQDRLQTITEVVILKTWQNCIKTKLLENAL